MAFTFFATLLDPVFSPLLIFKPYISIFIFSVMMTTIIYLINKLIMGNKSAKELKEKFAAAKENLMRAQKEGKKDEITKFLDEFTKINGQYLRQTSIVMFVSLIVLAVLYPWANYKFNGMTVISHPVITFLSSIPLIKLLPNWVMWYVLVSITGSWLLRKFVGE